MICLCTLAGTDACKTCFNNPGSYTSWNTTSNYDIQRKNEIRMARVYYEEEIIHCRDCAYRGWSDAGGHFCARGIGLTVKPDDFCSWGERREDE